MVPVSRGLLRMEEMIIQTLQILLVAAAVHNVLVAVAVTAVLGLLTPHPTWPMPFPRPTLTETAVAGHMPDGPQPT